MGLEIIIYSKPFRRAILFFKLMEIFPNIYKKTFIFRHLVSYSWKASSHQLQSLASIPQGAARGKKLGHLFFSFKEPFVFEEHLLFHFLTFCDFRSSVQDQGFYSFEQKTGRALAKKILLTEIRPEALAKKKVNVTDLYP